MLITRKLKTVKFSSKDPIRVSRDNSNRLSKIIYLEIRLLVVPVENAERDRVEGHLYQVRVLVELP